MNTILFFHQRVAIASTLALCLAATLSACGGGSSSEDTSAAVNPIASIPQGRWASTSSDPAYTVIAVPVSSGVNSPAVVTLWGLAQDGSSLYKLTANGGAGALASVTGQRFTLGSAGAAEVTPGSYSSTDNQLTLQSVLGESVTFSRSDAMSSPLRADQANGRWQAALGSIVVSWTVQSAGSTNNLSGTSTSGCTYSGTSTVVASQSLYQVTFAENCAGAVQNFSGVGTLSGDDNHLTVVATNAATSTADSRGVALLFARQP